MKSINILFFILLQFICNPILTAAQVDTSKIKKIKIKRNSNISGSFSLAANYTNINGQNSRGFSGNCGILLSKKYFIGVAWQVVTFNKEVDGMATKFALNYDGMYLEYHPKPLQKWHYAVGLLAGAGNIRYITPVLYNGTRFSLRDGNYTWVMEPNISLVGKLSKNVKIFGKIAYRITGQPSSDYVKREELRDFQASIGVTVGHF